MEDVRKNGMPGGSIKRTANHKVYLNNRNTMTLTGVKDVLSFDAAEILLETEEELLMIKGDELHVKRLSVEEMEVDIEGRIDSLVYSEHDGVAKKTTSLLERLFS